MNLPEKLSHGQMVDRDASSESKLFPKIVSSGKNYVKKTFTFLNLSIIFFIRFTSHLSSLTLSEGPSFNCEHGTYRAGRVNRGAVD